MFDKNFLIEIINDNLFHREELHSQLQDEEDKNFCDKTKKINDIKTEIENNDYISKNDYLRLAADFDNYKKREQRDKANMIRLANKDIILEILKVYDDIERVINELDKQAEANSIESGVKLVFNNLIKILNEEGCEKIDVKLGDSFDVNLMEAISTITTNKYPTDTVSEIYQSGWKLGGIIIRPTKVIIEKNHE